MPKSRKTLSKAKLSSKAEAKSKIMKPKSKKSIKPSSEPTPTPALSPLISSTIPTSLSLVPAALTIPTSTAPPQQKPTTHVPKPTTKNTSKSTKVKATPRNFVQKVPDASTKVDTMVRKSVVQGESVLAVANQVQNPPSKLNVLVSAVDVSPLDTLPPTSEKPRVEESTVEQGVANEEDKSEIEGASRDEKESDTDDKIGEQVNDSAVEENHSEEEDNSKNEGEDQEKVSENEGMDEESEEEKENLSEEYEGSMTNGNTVIAPSKETGKEKKTQEPRSLLNPFTRDEEVSTDEDDLPLSEVGKKHR
ncbi:uncharacterized protein [Nicotiana tomentosiformis]|uniref:uncharacterized protein n=1 Tax=Nicotiana tomentosiformis TaxID=4098 RepID=UPI00051ABDBD|nr:nucleolin-like [Nicotiana tomentosiformis]